MKKILQSLGYIAIGTVVMLLLFYLIKVPHVKFAESEFLLSYIGIFLGFAFSVVTFVMTLVDKGRQRVLSAPDYTRLVAK
ncbi:hypothetical protein [Hymenobacter siberiensis]|uniref:hypothetical protein n=1 Tax=Hymenobacter siberiensis TaxID=2848396 RepID=UPI001C1E2B7B|nr:hypothetical protein [Hymenobacter siberiensis]MBU6121159.1 hypothetical protein [Hymenobacter siberiensis]